VYTKDRQDSETTIKQSKRDLDHTQIYSTQIMTDAGSAIGAKMHSYPLVKFLVRFGKNLSKID